MMDNHKKRKSLLQLLLINPDADRTYCDKDELKSIARKVGFIATGRKDEIVERIINETMKLDIVQSNKLMKHILFKLKKWPLTYICEGLKLKVEGIIDLDLCTREQLRQKILEYIEYNFGVDDGIGEFNGEFEHLVDRIGQWKPKRRYPSEDGYQGDLSGFLEYKCNYSIVQEAGETNADILVDNKFAIEIKKNLSGKGDCDRLLGQVEGHFQAKNNVIIALCNTKNSAQLEALKLKIKNRFKHTNKVVIIRK